MRMRAPPSRPHHPDPRPVANCHPRSPSSTAIVLAPPVLVGETSKFMVGGCSAGRTASFP